MRRKTAKRLGVGMGVFVLAVAALAWFWNWDWFIPLAEKQASSALGRKVTMRHLHVRLGRIVAVAADGVAVANPPGFNGEFATADQLLAKIDPWAYLRHGQVVLPLIAADHPVVDAERHADGAATWTLGGKPAKQPAKPAKPAPPPHIGVLRIEHGRVRVVDAKLKADMRLDIHTEDGKSDDGKSEDGRRLVVTADGRYAGQPITGRFVGGGVLSLQDSGRPYPIDLHLANGPTKASLVGTVMDPLKFAGAKLKLSFSGPDMSLLYPLTGVPIPQTPAFDIAGNLDYAADRIRFEHFTGRVGSSDLNGTIAVRPHGTASGKPVVDADLNSRRVDLTDLGGFIGETPGRVDKTPQSPAQKQQLRHEETSGKFLPDTPIDMPRVRAADIHLKYKGDHIEGKFVPLDDIVVALDIEDGRIRLHPLSFAVGTGSIVANIDLTPKTDKQVHAVADVDFRRVDLSRIMQATHMFHGQGTIGGGLKLDTNGNSVATFLGHGNGGMQMFIQGGGDISALLTDLMGLQIGDAVLSAIGIPKRADLNCFVADFSLVRGDLQTRILLLDTSETRITGKGDVNLDTEKLALTLTPQSKHFSVGSLPTPIDIGGTMKHPSVMPKIAPLAARAGAAIGLAVLFPPAAILPTIELGVGNDGACRKALSETHAESRVRSGVSRHRSGH